jgi:hypothetical protein
MARSPPFSPATHARSLFAHEESKSLFSTEGLMTRKDFWIGGFVKQKNNCDLEAYTGHTSTAVEIVLQMSHNALAIVEEYVK